MYIRSWALGTPQDARGTIGMTVRLGQGDRTDSHWDG